MKSLFRGVVLVIADLGSTSERSGSELTVSGDDAAILTLRGDGNSSAPWDL